VKLLAIFGHRRSPGLEFHRESIFHQQIDPEVTDRIPLKKRGHRYLTLYAKSPPAELDI